MTFPAHLRSYWYVACLRRRLGRRPIACTVMGQPLVLFRDEAGKVAALLDRCPHRNAPLSKGWVHRGRLACPYHGWEFDRGGECRAIPGKTGGVAHALRCAPAFAAAEQGPFVWVYPTPGVAPEKPKPRFHVVDAPGYISLVRSFPLQAPLLDALENFLDGTHTHFVHAGLVRTAAHRKAVRATVRRGGEQVEAEYNDEGRQSGLIARLLGRNITQSVGRFLLPATVQLEYRCGPRVESRFTLYFTPQDEDRQEVFAVFTARAPRWLAWLLSAPLGWLFGRVVGQDQHILALQKINIRRFGGEDYTSTELDLLRPYISQLLQGGPLPLNAAGEKQVVLLL